MTLIVLFQPDTYIYVGWALLLLITAGAGLWFWRMRRKGWRIALALVVLFLWYFFLWGVYVGPRQFEVVQVEYASTELPPAFDGYRIVLFGDAHVASFNGWRKKLLRQVVDSINAQHADLVVFTGDLQNIRPQEIEEHKATLSLIKGKDGVFSVLGNHDYTDYLHTNDAMEIYTNEGLARSIPEDMGWTLLLNDRQSIHRDSARIIIAGMENDGEGRFPQHGDINSTLFGISRNDFVVMLEHDPTSWKRKILPHSHAQLTLSGHTHGGQVAFFGWTPASLVYKQTGGMYYAGQRALYVTKGIGGVVPFRFGVPPEIVVITLRHQD